MQLDIADIISIVRSVLPKRTKQPSPIAAGTYCIIRCRDAGVHAGEYVSHRGHEVVLKNSRRIWRFIGAQTLSELSVYGAKPDSKIAPTIALIVLGDACEIIPCQPAGEAFIRGALEYKC
jgi:hypothetical protein